MYNPKMGLRATKIVATEGFIGTASFAVSAQTASVLLGSVESASFALSSSITERIPAGTTAQRPEPAFAGMVRVNTSNNVPEWYDAVGDEWRKFGQNPVQVEYMIIAGGAGGGNSNGNPAGGGGGAGAYSTNVAGSGSGGGEPTQSPLTLFTNVPFSIVIGAGGSANSQGNASKFASLTASPGAPGGFPVLSADCTGSSLATGGGSAVAEAPGGTSIFGFGFGGGRGSGSFVNAQANVKTSGGGGGGIGNSGSDATSFTGGTGGAGLVAAITGSLMNIGGGGGGGGETSGTATDGGGNGGVAGETNSGAGGGGGMPNAGGANGGSGIVRFKFSSSFGITLSAGINSTIGDPGNFGDGMTYVEISAASATDYFIFT